MWWNVCTYRPEDINLPPVRAGVYVERYNLYVHMFVELRTCVFVECFLLVAYAHMGE